MSLASMSLYFTLKLGQILHGNMERTKAASTLLEGSPHIRSLWSDHSLYLWVMLQISLRGGAVFVSAVGVCTGLWAWNKDRILSLNSELWPPVLATRWICPGVLLFYVKMSMIAIQARLIKKHRARDTLDEDALQFYPTLDMEAQYDDGYRQFTEANALAGTSLNAHTAFPYLGPIQHRDAVALEKLQYIATETEGGGCL